MPDLASLLHARGASGELEVGHDSRLVLVEGDAQPPHRFHHVDRERPDRDVGRLVGGAARAVERVLLTVAHDAQPAVENPEVGVEGGADPEVELAVAGEPVEPVAVVGVAVTGGRYRDGL